MKNLVFVLSVLLMVVSCKKESKVPTSIQITQIEVTKFPFYDSNNASWDIGSGPDIYVSVNQGSSALYKSQGYVQNADPGVTLSFSPTNLYIYDINERMSVSMYDFDDFDADDYMGGVEGFIYSDGATPSTVTFSCSSCNTAYTLHLSYRY